jgi:hypothetical protein
VISFFLLQVFKPKEDSDPPKPDDWAKDFSRGCKLARLLRLWFPGTDLIETTIEQ